MKGFFPERIFLIGFISSGKTLTGRNLAKKIGYKFIDTDEEIEKKELKSIKEIINLRGEEVFRNLEWKLIKTFKKEKKIVVALSSGAGASKSILEFLKEIGFVIFLNTPWDLIIKRIEEKKELVPSNIKINDLYSIYISRNKIYKKANLVVNFNEYENMEETTLRIERLIREYTDEIPYNF